MSRVHEVVDAAGMAGVNVLCLQEAWTMPFACVPQFCCFTPFVFGVSGYGMGVGCFWGGLDCALCKLATLCFTSNHAMCAWTRWGGA